MNNYKFDFLAKTINNINIEMLEHGHFFGDKSWKHYSVTSPFNRLYFVLDGEGYVENNNGRTSLKPGNAYIIPLHSTYSYICNNHIEKFYVHFQASLFEGYDIFEPAENCIEQPFNRHQVADLMKCAKSGNICDVLYCKSFLEGVVSGFLKELPAVSDSRIDAIFKYHKLFSFIKKNCSALLTPGLISNETGIPASSLAKGFRKDTGKTLKSYINGVIIQSAKEKLLLTDKSIKEIAFLLQFCDEFYFSRFFKRYVGLSPRDYRNKNKI